MLASHNEACPSYRTFAQPEASRQAVAHWSIPALVHLRKEVVDEMTGDMLWLLDCNSC